MKRPGSNAAILWISLLGLYLELLFIRWIGTEIRIFAYLQNTVLVVCFLGLGIGLFTSRRPISIQRGLFALVVLAGALAVPASRQVLTSTSTLLSVLGELNIWEYGIAGSVWSQAGAVAVGLGLTFLLMILVLEPFIPIGRLLGRLLDEHQRPIYAYSINVFGSLCGIWLFVLLSRLSAPPATWFAVLTILVLPALLARRPIDRTSVVLLMCLAPLVFMTDALTPSLRTVWSPYQKLAVFDARGPDGEYPTALRYEVQVNNTTYQAMFDLSSPIAGDGAEASGPARGLSIYDVPGLLHPEPDLTLVVGAGTGNDVAGLLRHGAGEVTAVDIDPEILALGREYHPERPYQSPRVRLVNTDARSFFATTPDRYDVVAFGFLDAHTTTSMTNARLDHYVYTLESLRRVRDLLRDGGILCLSFLPPRPFVLDRLAAELREVFGEDPLVYAFPVVGREALSMMLVAGDLETVRDRIASVPELDFLTQIAQERPVQLAYTTPPATDDWPYLYLEHPRVPLLFVLLAGLLGLIVIYAGRTMELPDTMDPRGWHRNDWHFFFLGAAFLLLEVQNISKASVVLGNTWLVNAVIISGVLAMVLVANAVVDRRPGIRLAPVYGVLLAVVVGLYFVDLARFAFLPYTWKAVLVGGLVTLPMFFSGIAFARAFAVTRRKDYALGANLLGALLGAVLETLSFLLGIKALLLAVALFYAAAALTRPDSDHHPARQAEPAA